MIKGTPRTPDRWERGLNLGKFPDHCKAGLRRQAGTKREPGIRGQGSREDAGSCLASFVEAVASTGICKKSRK